MGFKNKRKDIFSPRELKEENVQAIIGQCRGQDWNSAAQALTRHRADIRYLLGQLAPVHQGVKECAVDASCFARYSGANWTEDPGTFFDLCLMGSVFGYCALNERDGQYFLTLDGELKPTLSPRDPGFIDWVDTLDGLAVQLQYARDSGKSDEDLLPLFKRAAEAGVASAQYMLGKLYEDRDGTEDDYTQAVVWYQKAAEQGHTNAKYHLARCQTVVKALQGDAEAQYQYGKNLDTEKALQFLSASARQGHRDAAFWCGMIYGLKKDDQEQALRYFQSAVEAGDSLSQKIIDLMQPRRMFQKAKLTSCEDAVAALINNYGDLSPSEKGLLQDCSKLYPHSLQKELWAANNRGWNALAGG